MTQTFDQADVFLIPLLNGAFGIGQIVTPDATPDAALCLITNITVAGSSGKTDFSASNMRALMLIETTQLASGTWPVIGFVQLPTVSQIAKWQTSPDALPKDPATVEGFTNALFGLYPWDAFGADAFTNLLIDPTMIPENAMMQADT